MVMMTCGNIQIRRVVLSLAQRGRLMLALNSVLLIIYSFTATACIMHRPGRALKAPLRRCSLAIYQARMMMMSLMWLLGHPSKRTTCIQLSSHSVAALACLIIVASAESTNRPSCSCVCAIFNLLQPCCSGICSGRCYPLTTVLLLLQHRGTLAMSPSATAAFWFALMMATRARARVVRATPCNTCILLHFTKGYCGRLITVKLSCSCWCHRYFLSWLLLRLGRCRLNHCGLLLTTALL